MVDGKLMSGRWTNDGFVPKREASPRELETWEGSSQPQTMSDADFFRQDPKQATQYFEARYGSSRANEKFTPSQEEMNEEVSSQYKKYQGDGGSDEPVATQLAKKEEIRKTVETANNARKNGWSRKMYKDTPVYVVPKTTTIDGQKFEKGDLVSMDGRRVRSLAVANKTKPPLASSHSPQIPTPDKPLGLSY